MIANNFTYPKGFKPNPNLPDFDQDDGPQIEEIDEDDLD